MTKVWNYVVLITGISILMALAGIDMVLFSDLFSKIGLTLDNSGTGNFEIDNSFWSIIFGTNGLLTSIGAVGLIGIGTYLYTKEKGFLIISLITGTLFYWISVMGSIIKSAFQYGSPWGVLVLLTLVPLNVGFIVSCVEWFYGNDS